MCDYSLMGIQNRLAREGEKLVTHRFSTGSMGMASVHDVDRLNTNKKPAGIMEAVANAVQDMFSPQPASAPAVCIPPGARLTLSNIPTYIQKEAGVSDTEKAVFTQLSARENAYRDAFQFSNGNAVLIQHFPQNVPVVVDSLANSVEREEIREEAFAVVRR